MRVAMAERVCEKMWAQLCFCHLLGRLSYGHHYGERVSGSDCIPHRHSQPTGLELPPVTQMRNGVLSSTKLRM